MTNNLNEEELNNIKHFYIPASLKYEIMGFLGKTMMKMASKMLEKRTIKKEDIVMQNSIKKVLWYIRQRNNKTFNRIC